MENVFVFVDTMYIEMDSFINSNVYVYIIYIRIYNHYIIVSIIILHIYVRTELVR